MNMKSKLFYLLFLFAFSITYAQIPTNGLQGMYEFTNGSLSDGAYNNDFTETGTVLTAVNDRFNSANSALNLSTSYLTRPNISLGNNISLSFWIKTTTNTNDFKVIIDDSQNTGTSPHAYPGASQTGYTVMLRNGQIRAQARVSQGIYGVTARVATSNFIADDNWHHIAVKFSAYSKSGYINKWARAEIFVDGTSVQNDDRVTSVTSGSPGGLDTTGNVVIGYNREGTVSASNRYNDVIDDVLFYNRLLTNQEISNIVLDTFEIIS